MLNLKKLKILICFCFLIKFELVVYNFQKNVSFLRDLKLFILIEYKYAIYINLFNICKRSKIYNNKKNCLLQILKQLLWSTKDTRTKGVIYC